MKNKILLLLLSLLGFSCGNNKEDPFSVAYAPPTPVDYVKITVRGRVTDTNGTPVKGIRITPTQTWDASFPKEETYAEDIYPNEPVFTEADGTYEMDDRKCLYYSQFYAGLQVEDVDGEANGGLFRTQAAEVKISQENLVDAGSWMPTYFKQADDIVIEKMD